MNQLTIYCDKLDDRIKEQHLAEKRGWHNGCYGAGEKGYYVVYYKKKRGKR
jgi:hypothetical protein